jgi:hypothetical protein
MTFIGWLFLLAPVAVIGYAGIRVIPVYLNYTKVARVLEQVKDEYKGGDTVARNLVRESIAKRLNIEGIYSPELDQIEINKQGSGWVIRANYEETIKLFYNISLLLSFDKSVEI